MEVRFPELVLPAWVLQEDGFHIIGMVRRLLRDADVGAESLNQFTDSAFAGDHEDLIATVRKWVTVE